MAQHVDCPSVRLWRSATVICWNTSKIISRLISLRFLLGLTPTRVIWSNGNTFKIRVEYSRGWGHKLMSTKTCNISETMQDRTNVTMIDKYKSHTRFREVPESMTFERPWTAETQSCRKKRFTDPTSTQLNSSSSKVPPLPIGSAFQIRVAVHV